MTDDIEAIHDFWFGELDADGLPASDRNSRWFGANAETDDLCRRRFGACLEQALRGELDHWAETDRGLVALVVALDQFSRNIHRGSAMAFAGDERALARAQEAIDSGRDQRLPAIHRVFLYLPLEHCEDLETQERCVVLFEELEDSMQHPPFANFTRYAVAHREVIARFGRFPHRNALLGRSSSPEELAYMAEHGGF
jgi:uncharacterized protein (DUF924 family)